MPVTRSTPRVPSSLLWLVPLWCGLGCQPTDAEGEAAIDGPSVEGLYEVQSHEVIEGSCNGTRRPVDPLDDGRLAPSFLILVAETNSFGGDQIAALACDDSATCDVEDEFRLYFDLGGHWKFVRKHASLVDDRCALDITVDTLTLDGEALLLKRKLYQDTLPLPAGEETCVNPVRDTEPQDLPCIELESVTAVRTRK